MGEEEEEYPHYEPFYRASSFAHPVMPTKKYDPPEKCHYVNRATIMKHPPIAPAAIPGDYPRGFSDETIQYVADLRKRIMPYIKFDIASNPPKEVEYNVGGFQRPKIEVDIPLEFLPPDPERVKKQEEAQAKSEAADRAVKAAQSILIEAETKITQAEAKTKIVQAQAKLSAETAEIDSQASALAKEAVEKIAQVRPLLTEAIQAKEAAVQAAKASGYVEASKFAEAATRSVADVEELRSRCAGVETRATNLQSEVEKRRALREAEERARKALQEALELARKATELALAAEEAANDAERRMGEMEEVIEVEIVEAAAKSIAQSANTAQSKAREAQQMWERARQAAQSAGNKDADNAVSQAQQKINLAQSAAERARVAQSNVQERADSMKKGCGACCVIM